MGCKGKKRKSLHGVGVKKGGKIHIMNEGKPKEEMQTTALARSRCD
jgi:hypothetical protein